MIIKCAKGGDALHSTPLVLVTCDAGLQPQTSIESIRAMDASAGGESDNEIEDEDPDAGSCDAPNPQESIEFPELPRPRVPHCLDLIKDDATTVRPA